MKARSLFPDPDLPIVPAANRSEPDLWIRRLVVVAERKPRSAIIRDVSFRPGLNIVRVAPRPAGETRPIGHSVGKTLLARLIRYCLGENHFAAAEITSRISNKLPGAYVLGEILVLGQPWVVVRPLRDAALTESWVLPGADWRMGLGDPSRMRRYNTFHETLTQATVARLPELRLPGANHAGRWLDLLAFLARDQECGYKHYNEWRDPDASSGTARLQRDDASLLIRWVMGLLDTGEIDEVSKRHRLLREQTDARAEVERLTHVLEASRPALVSRIGLREEDVIGELFARRGRETIKEHLERLEAELNSFTQDPQTLRAHEQAVRVAQELAVAESEMTRLRGMRQSARTELQKRQQLPTANKETDTVRKCPLERADCPLRVAMDHLDISDSRNSVSAADLEVLLEQYDQQILVLEERCRAIRQNHLEAEEHYSQQRLRRQQEISGTLAQIGRWQLLGEQFQEYARVQKTRDEALGRVDTLERQVRESRERQEAARSERDRRHARISNCFDWTLKRLLGDEAGGIIRLDARGLHPAPHSSVAANGAAMATLATVLGLDLATLAAAVSGVGYLPGLLVHDSPKEADMEAVLYERIFTLALELERAYKGRSPAFQYIVTTTTPPPAEADRDPYVRLTLDARQDSEVLLRARF